MSNLTEQQISQMRYDEGYKMGVSETAYLIFRDLHDTCPHMEGLPCWTCLTCINKIEKKWMNE